MQFKSKIFLLITIFLREIFILNANEIRNETKKYSNNKYNNNRKVFPLSIQSKIVTNTSNVRANRQVHYNPQIFYIHNYINRKIECSISHHEKKAFCLPLHDCPKQQHQQHQLQISNKNRKNNENLSGNQYWPTSSYEICTYTDRHNQISTGVCCPSLEVTAEAEDDINKQSTGPNDLDRSKGDGDSEILELPLNFSYDLEPNKNNTQDELDANNYDYDPINEWRIDVDFKYVAPSYWPLPIWSFSPTSQWPVAIPTLGPIISNWPPQVPTHPPNHHYPTHPTTKPQYTTRPSYDLTTKERPATAVTVTPQPSNKPLTTKRPSYYPGYYPGFFGIPQYNFTILTTTAATTTTLGPLMNNGDNYGLPIQCGHRNVPTKDQERIVGGINASPHEFPWMAVIFRAGRQICGGSIITNNHILTAAHCVARLNSWDVGSLTVNLGDYNIRTDFEVKHVTRRIKRLIRHKGFDFTHLHNDISLLILNEPVQYTYGIRPLCLPTTQMLQARTYSGKVGLVAGWGSLREKGPQPAILQKVQVPIWTNSECAQVYGTAAPGGIISSMICAGQAEKDSCTGDSGGPMVINEGDRYYQVGIVSWGIGCGKGHYPGVYTRVTSLLPWIYKNIKLPIN